MHSIRPPVPIIYIDASIAFVTRRYGGNRGALPQTTAYPKRNTDEPYYKEPMYMPPPGYEADPRDDLKNVQQQLVPVSGTSSNYMHIWERPLPQPSKLGDGSKCTCPAGGLYDTAASDSTGEGDYNSLDNSSRTGAAMTTRGQVYGNNTMVRKECERGSPPGSEDSRYYQLDLDGLSQ